MQEPDGVTPLKIYHAVENPITHEIRWQTTGVIKRVDVIAYSTDSNDLYFRDGSNNVHG